MTILDARPHLTPALNAWLDRISLGKFNTTNVKVSMSEEYENIDPGTGLVLSTIPISATQDVVGAVKEARTALDDGRWSDRDPDFREEVLFKLADLMARDFDALVTLEAIDTGKPRADAVLDIKEAEMVLRYYAGWITKVTGKTIPTPRYLSASTQRGPVGVCAAITPWNFPLPILMYKLAPALAFGNSFVAKPAELAPLSAIYLAELCTEAGIPDGVMSIILGPGRKVGTELLAQPGLDKIAFTGSTATGRAIMKAAAEHPIRVSLELGGKSPQVVFASADIDKAVEGVAAGIWTNAGQLCVAGSRLIVEESIKEEFLNKLVEYTNTYSVGHALDAGSMMGPMISEVQRDNAWQTLERAEQDGARLLTAGTLTTESGYFIMPTIIDGLPSEHSIHQEEIFGPALAVDTFRTEDEAISKANCTKYGLAAGVWTGAAGQGQRLARNITSGTVWINTYGLFHPTLPFGGTKASGFGRELGESAVEAYTEITTVVEDIS